MESRVLLDCGECGLRREVVGEIPEEYTRSFARAVEEDGWVPRPGNTPTLICGACLVKEFAGHETVDDEEKIRNSPSPRLRGEGRCE